MPSVLTEQGLASGAGAGRSKDRTGVRTAAAGLDRLVVPAYTLSALFFLTAALDIYTLSWPLNPSAVAWRFGTVGAASNYLITAFFGVVLACFTAAYRGHRRTLRVLSVMCGVLGLALLGVLVDFSMNVLQLRAMVAPDEAQAFRIGSAKAGLKYLAMVGAFLITGASSWRAARALTP